MSGCHHSLCNIPQLYKMSVNGSAGLYHENLVSLTHNEIKTITLQA